MAYQIWMQVVETDDAGNEVGNIGDPECAGHFETRVAADAATVTMLAAGYEAACPEPREPVKEKAHDAR